MIARRLEIVRQRESLSALIHTDERWRIGAFALVAGLFSAIALLLTPPAVVTYGTGMVADRQVKAARSVVFISESLTAAERERAVTAVPRQYARNSAAVANETVKLGSEIAALARVRDSSQARDAKVAALGRLPEIALTQPTAVDVVEMPVAEWDVMVKDLENLLRSMYAQDIRPEQVDLARSEVPKALPAVWSDRQRRVATEVLRSHLHANATFDQAATAAAQAAARASIVPVEVRVASGEVIVREGAVVTAQDVEKLRALGLVNPGFDWRGAFGLVLWALLCSGVLALFFARYAGDAWADDRRVLLVGLSLVAATAAARILVPGHALAAYVAPYAAMAMMLTVLAGGRAALATQIALALNVGIMGGQVELVAYVLVPALLGMGILRRGATTREFAMASVAVAAGSAGVIVAFLLVERTTDVLGALQLGAAAVASGIGAGILSFGGVVLLGHLFRITTVFELRELGDPNHPLLRQLLLRTPGTYHHSLLVANLAERAAEVIGADPLVARVGAYYHDIGKMRNPSAFIENQTGTNPHDELDPLVSAGIVTAHIRDGLALADRYNLPTEIREMIPGHHGTSVMRYFFQVAQARGQAEESAFRHPGPKPRTREAGIVMLADGTEASVRSLDVKNADTIRAMVEKIVAERVADGQLDECDLTLRDVQRIKVAFCELLAGVYHERIPYLEDRIAVLRPAARTPFLPDADQRSR
ncbi:MAG: HDIG domain-containing protein [Chloroflexi bacterium]|nr:HDIG domain-containing protein [Chloroflexota bacterium]